MFQSQLYLFLSMVTWSCKSGQTNITVGARVSRQLPTLWPVKKQKGRKDEGNDNIIQISP